MLFLNIAGGLSASFGWGGEKKQNICLKDSCDTIGYVVPTCFKKAGPGSCNVSLFLQGGRKKKRPLAKDARKSHAQAPEVRLTFISLAAG